MKTLLMAVLLVTSVVGCIKKDDDLTQEEARNAGDSLGAGIEDSAKTYGPVKDGAGADAPCATLTGNTADPDLDNIPTSATLTYNCIAMAFGYTGTLTGTMMVTDDAPTAVAWAFTGGANLHATLTGPLGANVTRDWDGQIVATQTTNFALHRTLAVNTVITDAQHRSVTITEDNDWTVTFTPILTWTPGSIIVTGSLAATGTWNVTAGAHEAMATLATPTPITVDPGCASRVTGGTVTATYQGERGMHTITVNWTGCGAHTVTHE